MGKGGEILTSRREPRDRHRRDVSRALRVSRRLEAGTVWINRYGRSRDHLLPTGGWKASDLGKDLGREAYLANRRSKSVLIDL
ncbi:aldehyde dehydrogenase [Citreicella sp. SE45]|nr:aldehyde dehydrogenase [Citreicella sp. SE45]